MPRWGFPLLAWRWPLALPTRAEVDPVARTAALASTATSTLWITAIVAGIAAAAESWRYFLLVRSLSTALAKTPLQFSDALVATAGVLTLLLGVLSGLVVVLWALRARVAAHERIGIRHARPEWQLIAGVLVPGWNLFVPGSVLAEIEHAVLVGEKARDRDARPRPSRLVGLWWASWIGSLLIGWTTFVWSFLPGVQASADGVVLHILTNIAVVVLALLTTRVIRSLTQLLTPVDPTEIRRLRVLGVRDAPAPDRAERPGTSPR